MSDVPLDTLSTSNRRILDLRALGLRQLLVCGRYQYKEAQPPLELQSHPDWLVVAYLERGFQLYEVGGEIVELRGGQMMRVFPGECYSTGRFPVHRGTFFWFIISTNPGPGLDGAWGMDQREASALLSRLTNRSTPRIESAGSVVGEAFRLIIESGLPVNPLDTAILRHRLVSILLESGIPSKTNQLSPVLAGIVARALSVDPYARPGAEELAALTGLSVSSFYERFIKETGMTPKEFSTRWRVSEALKLLRAGTSVTNVAHDLGFSSSQYFASVVKKHSGRIPSFWVKSSLAKNKTALGKAKTLPFSR